MRAIDIYPTSEGISLYDFQNPPTIPATPVNPNPTIIVTNKILNFGTLIFSGCSKYIFANHIPKTNSQRYCKKKLFQILSSSIPKQAVIVAHIRLISNEICPPHIHSKQPYY